jgi:hypothetical protein
VLYPAELRGHTSFIYRINHRKRSPEHVSRVCEATTTAIERIDGSESITTTKCNI